MTAYEKARYFIEHETQFHFGFLPTEQSNPQTAHLAEVLHADLLAGLRMLHAVDCGLLPIIEHVYSSEPFKNLVSRISALLRGTGRIAVSGCGATGRLAVLLEAAWRKFWRKTCERRPQAANRFPGYGNRVTSIMTGGDYAFICAVENFEDYRSFGKQQVREAELGPGDLIIAISEGGETSSVIGTLEQALENGAGACFVFNNPGDILCAHIDRSREILQDPRVLALDLSSGPMAVAGSTRMQAVTMELLAVGTALELSLWSVMQEAGFADTDMPLLTCPSEAYDRFAALLADLGSEKTTSALARMVETEERLYKARGRLTYVANGCLLDVITDTAERTPTFMLPPFRKHDDTVSAPSWAFVKNPLFPTPLAWQEALGRDLRCLTWDGARYAALGAPEKMRNSPPKLDQAEMYKFLIGNENDTSRYENVESLAVAVIAGNGGKDAQCFYEAFERLAAHFTHSRYLLIGVQAETAIGGNDACRIPCIFPCSGLGLFEHLAVKLVFNTLSTATMGNMGRLAGNWMVHVSPTNKKLVDRGTRLVAELANVGYNEACVALHETMEELANARVAGYERPSPVAATIERLRAGKL